MLTIKRRYENGIIQPLEPVEGFEGQEVIITFLTAGDNEASLFADMRAASLSSFQDCWDNEEDAVYDNL